VSWARGAGAPPGSRRSAQPVPRTVVCDACERASLLGARNQPGNHPEKTSVGPHSQPIPSGYSCEWERRKETTTNRRKTMARVEGLVVSGSQRFLVGVFPFKCGNGPQERNRRSGARIVKVFSGPLKESSASSKLCVRRARKKAEVTARGKPSISFLAGLCLRQPPASWGERLSRALARRVIALEGPPRKRWLQLCAQPPPTAPAYYHRQPQSLPRPHYPLPGHDQATTRLRDLRSRSSPQPPASARRRPLDHPIHHLPQVQTYPDADSDRRRRHTGGLAS